MRRLQKQTESERPQLFCDELSDNLQMLIFVTKGGVDLENQNMKVPECLRKFFVHHPRMALAFSGGTDSAYLLYAAIACGIDVHAYYIKSHFQPAFELEDAKHLANDLNAKMTVTEVDILSHEAVSSNSADRCYHCKSVLFSTLFKVADKDGYAMLMDGTNASDDADDRPGMRALTEMEVLSPLRLCGITKSQVRELSKEAEIFTWNKPAYACLATRIPTGETITVEVLQKVERAENTLFNLRFTDFRVRVVQDAAKLQFPANQLPLVIEKREAILDALLSDFSDILLDLQSR